MNAAALTDFFTFSGNLGTAGRSVPEGTQRHDGMGADDIVMTANPKKIRRGTPSAADAIAYTQTTCSTGAMPIPQSSAANIMDEPCSLTWQASTHTQPHKPGNKN